MTKGSSLTTGLVIGALVAGGGGEGIAGQMELAGVGATAEAEFFETLPVEIEGGKGGEVGGVADGLDDLVGGAFFGAERGDAAGGLDFDIVGEDAVGTEILIDRSHVRENASVAPVPEDVRGGAVVGPDFHAQMGRGGDERDGVGAAGNIGAPVEHVGQVDIDGNAAGEKVGVVEVAVRGRGFGILVELRAEELGNGGVQMFEDAVELGGAEAIAVDVDHPQGGAAVQNEVREAVARKDAIIEMLFSGEIGGRVAVVGGLQIEQIRRDGGQMAALVVVPDVEVAEGEEIGHDVLERLRQLGIVARAPMPDGGAGAAGDEDFGVVVERAADILEGGISGEVELLQVGIFEADAFQIGQVGENDVPEGGGLKAFDGFEVGASREIEGVGEGVVRGGEILRSDGTGR